MEMILSGYTLREVGGKIGLSKDAIYKRLRKYGKILEGMNQAI